MSEKRPTAEQMAKFKKNANDQSLSAEVRAKFKAIVDKFENVTEEVGEDVVKVVEPKKRGRKPATEKKTPASSKKSTGKKSEDDIEKAKAEIKRKTGKTEEECESIIEQYRALRTKAQEGKRKAEQASADNKKRVEKLDKKGDLIEGTSEKTADAVIESTTKDVVEKIEKQIEAVEEKAEKEAKAEVAKDKTIKTPKEKKEAVEAKVEKKVAEKTKTIVKRVVIDTSELLTSIATSLGKFDKDSQKEFLIKLRSDIDKLLSKYAFGGMTDGATQVMNIQQSNLSASSVNPTLFANGGIVQEDAQSINTIALLNGVRKSENTYKEFKRKLTQIIKRNGYRMPTEKAFEIAYETNQFAKGGGVEYKTAMSQFNDELISHPSVVKMASHYNRTPQEVVRELQPRISTKGNRDKKTTEVYIDFKDTNSGLSVKHKKTFATGGEVSDLDYSDILAVLEEKLTDSVEDLPNDFEMSYTAEGEEVEHQSRDGFIAFTDGGYEIRWFEQLSQFYSSGNSLPTKALDKEKDRQIEYNFQLAKERFMDDYPEIVEELGEENIDYNSLYEAGYESEAEELSEMEMDFDGEGTIMCEIGAYYYSPTNDRGMDGEHTLRLFGLVNLESPYHRSGNLEDRYDLDITFNSIEELEEQVEAGLKQIIDWFNGSHYDESTEELRIVRMAKGGMTEHGLRIGDEIMGESKDLNAVFVKNKDEWHNVFLDKGQRYRKGGNVSSMLRNRRGM